jgi:hypothetical protein
MRPSLLVHFRVAASANAGTISSQGGVAAPVSGDPEALRRDGVLVHKAAAVVQLELGMGLALLLSAEMTRFQQGLSRIAQVDPMGAAGRR